MIGPDEEEETSNTPINDDSFPSPIRLNMMTDHSGNKQEIYPKVKSKQISALKRDKP